MAIVLPGDDVDPAVWLPEPSDKKPLRLGPGLRMLLPTGDIAATVCGRVAADRRKNLVWVDCDAPVTNGRYMPCTGDLVLGQVLHVSADQAVVALAPHDDTMPLRAVLPVLAFANASRKNRPDLNPGSLVYARVAFAARHMDTELECVDPATGKADGLGLLTGGMVFAVSLRLARHLLAPSSPAAPSVLDLLAAEGLAFETAIGRNGRLWVRAAKDTDTRTVVRVGRAVAAADAGDLDAAQLKAFVRKLVRGG